MASWGSFVWGFFVGQVTLGLFLALVRQGSASDVVESPPIAAGHETPAGRESFSIEAA